MTKTVLEYESGKITAKLEQGERTLLRNVQFSIHEEETLALVGETGAGKTMTALSIMKLLPGNVHMADGKILFDGEPLPEEKKMRGILGNRIVYIPQNGLEFLNPAASIRTHLYDSLKKMGIKRKTMEQTALEKLRLAGFAQPEAVIDKCPFQISGGMAQRVIIALSACSDARLIIADEPTNGLDESGRAHFMRMLDEVFPKAGKLIITHDIGIAALCDRVLVLLGGKAMELGAACDVLAQPRHPYTKALLRALVKNGMEQTPVLRGREGDCTFYTRCPDACAACLGEMRHNTDNKTEWWCSGR